MSVDAIRAVQARLKELHHDPGPIDGIGGPKTQAALQDFFASRELPFTVTATAELLQAVAPGQDAPEPSDELPWIAEAKRAWGRHEGRDNAWLTRWLGSDHHALGDPARFPWCGDFVETSIRLGLPAEPLPGPLGENPYWARNWLHFGRAVPPSYGAVVVFSRGSGGHVAFAVGEDDSDLYCLGGNQSNSVCVTRVSKQRLLGARWPATWPLKETGLPRMSPGSIPRTVNEV